MVERENLSLQFIQTEKTKNQKVIYSRLTHQNFPLIYKNEIEKKSVRWYVFKSLFGATFSK